MCATKCDCASVNKSFEKKFSEFQKTYVESADVEMLFCKAHFLLVLSSQCEKVLKENEVCLEQESGERLGRNSSAKFKHFHGAGESSTGSNINILFITIFIRQF